MSKEIKTYCDNDECYGGKYFFKCNNGHDICSLCYLELKLVSDGTIKKYCPLCIESAIIEE